MSKVYRLLLSDMSKGRIMLFMLAQIIGVAIMASSLFLYFDVTSNLNGSSGSNNYLVITKPISMLREIISSKSGFSSKELSKFEQIDGVESIGEFKVGEFQATATFGFSGTENSIFTNLFFESIDESYMDVVPNEWNFDPIKGIVPIIIPQNYVNLYNFGFAQSVGLPKLSKEIIGNITLRITIYGEDGRSVALKGRVVDFSTRLNTILVPKEFIEWGNRNYAEFSETNLPQRIIIKFDSAKSTNLTNFIKERGYEIESNSLDFERISRVVAFLLSATLIIGMIITLLSLYLIIMTLYLMIERNRTKINNLSIIGYTTSMIIAPFNRLAFMVKTISFAVAYMISLAVRAVYITQLPNYLQLQTAMNLLFLPTLIIIAIYIILVIISRRMVKQKVEKSIV